MKITLQNQDRFRFTEKGHLHEHECLYCGKEYAKPGKYSNAQWAENKYCSFPCQKNARKGIPKNGLRKTCVICGKNFKARPAYDKEGMARYCSRICMGVGMRVKDTKFICRFCKNEFFRKQAKRVPTFCSTICRDGNNAKNQPKGEFSPQWKGGMVSLQRRIRANYRYRQWRSDVFTRDNFTCQWCDEKSGDLQSDHIKPLYLLLQEYEITTYEQAMKCEELWNINNGRTLCHSCHRKTETYGHKAQRKSYQLELI